jgi:tetratricopeptide (TPR) repeat protein
LNDPPEAKLRNLKFSLNFSPGQLDGFDIQTQVTKHLTDVVEVTLSLAAHYAGDYESSIKAFSGLLARDKNLQSKLLEPAYLHMLRAEAYTEVNKYDEALDDLDEAIRRLPDSHEAYKLRAFCHAKKFDVDFDERHIDLALDDLSTIVNDNPDEADVYSFRGFLHLVKAFVPAAKANWGQPFDDTPANTALISKPEIKAAEFDLSKSISLQPRNAQFYLHRSIFYAVTQNTKRAMEDARKVAVLAGTGAEWNRLNAMIAIARKQDRQHRILQDRSQLRVFDRCQHFNAPAQIAIHQIGTADKHLFFSVIGKIEDTAVFEESPDDASHSDIVRHLWQTRS